MSTWMTIATVPVCSDGATEAFITEGKLHRSNHTTDLSF